MPWRPDNEVFPSDEPQAGTENQTTVKTIGPLTDVDVIKLRPCEKKQVPIIAVDDDFEIESSKE